ncbi:putative acetolactate synthase [Aeropyrum pernix K1]|uniref:2-oxoacid oxidoreductase (ferredoxin) n=1 Tax=Aeropyrum pernix (strain ATCC 700893 / DSM 11879 / JCM 9820 / NBRC 100138 / K1) TaxID=272557 RepID=Q9Y8X5_AERPE|nr:thiamine pyrophosphate-dependent enzyme [Aeropyrum pernix]BAA81525.1 putative acetolactate synthase [Aeropyrum pernix K1]
MATVAEAIARGLVAAGVARIYGIIGTSIVDFVDALYDYRDRIDFVTTRHEQVAVSAADAEYRSTRRLAAAAVHAGPGFLNTLISLGIAAKDRVPLLLVSGGVRRRLRGLDAWLEVDQASIARPLVKYYGVLDSPGEVLDVLVEALRSALSPPMGPAVVEIPEDLWRSQTTVSGEAFGTIPKAPVEGPGLGGHGKTLFSMLMQARRPVILATGELVYSPGFSQEMLLRLAEATGAYIVVSGNGRGACPEDHPRCLGRIGFGGGSLAADRALENSDMVLALGHEFDDITTYGYNMLPQGDVVMVSQDPSAKARPRYYDLVNANPVRALEELSEMAEGVRRLEEWDRMVQEFRREWGVMLEEAVRRETRLANPDRFFRLLNMRIPRNRVVSGGQGTHILYVYNHIQIYTPGSFLAATNLGAMGYALPAVIGSSKALPGGYHLCVAGDGELMMTVQDIETIVREGLDVKIVLVNDDSYKVLYLRQVLQKGGRVYETLLSNPDFSRLAEAFGVRYASVSRSGDEEEGLEALTSPGPALVEVKVDRDDIPPLNLDYTLRMSM